ncbi:MAG: hypothetical protein IJM59_02910 [Proteobacteria bacterium]|nr:hypothetical protein [Pseudomonadota bacterium]
MDTSGLAGIHEIPAILSHPHICGIGGIGMSGVALILSGLGCPISGSDLRHSEITDLLQNQGADIHYPHDTDSIKNASCVIASRSFPQNHPEILEAQNRNIPVISRTCALGIIQSFTHFRPVLCFGSVARAKLARLTAQACQCGYCTGVADAGGNTLHAAFGNQMMLDIDERDYMAAPQDFMRLRGDVIISDWQSPHFGYYSDDFNPRQFVQKLLDEFLPDDAMLIAPKTRNSSTEIAFSAFKKHRQTQSFSFTLDPLTNSLSFPESWNRPPAHYEGTFVDASALAGAEIWLKLNNIHTHPNDFACIGWFSRISQTHFHEIRMHPMHIRIAMQNLKLKSQNHPIHAAIRPFSSTLNAYPPEVWADTFKNVGKLIVITPPYEGCTPQDCDKFCKSMQSVCPCECMTAQQAHQTADPNDFWLWIGAPDIL